MLRLRKDSIMRRSSSSASTPPTAPVEAQAQASSPSKSDKHDKQEDNHSISTPAHPHGFKALGRRVSHSKPVRMLKGIASRSSLRRSSSEVVPPAQRRVSSESATSLATSAASAERSMKEDVVREVGGLNTYSEEVASAQTQAQAQTQAAVQVTPEVEAAPEQAGEREAERTLVPVVPEQTTAEASGVVHEAQNINKEVVSTVETVQAPEEPSVSASQDAVATSDIPAPVAAITDASESDASPEVKKTNVTENVTESITSMPSTEDSHVIIKEAGHVRVDSDDLSLSSTSTSVDPSPVPISDSFVIIKVNNTKMEEPDINPFVLDDPAEALSDSGKSESTDAGKIEETGATLPPVQSVELSQTESVTVPAAQAEPVTAASRPPPPAPSPAPASEAASSEEETAPELHAPALTLSTLFLPVPNTDPLSALLTKHIPEPHLRPPRDVTGEWTHADFHTLVMTNNWRALAKMARDRIVAANPRDVELILNLWYIRLSSLARLRLFNQTTAECENLFSVLATLEPPDMRTYILTRGVLPFELEVLRARCAYWAGDPLGYLDDVAALLRRCRVRAREEGKNEEDGENEKVVMRRSMWKERAARMALVAASQLVEMKEYAAATALLEPLSASGAAPAAPDLRAAIGRVYLQAGRLDRARVHFAYVAAVLGDSTEGGEGGQVDGEEKEETEGILGSDADALRTHRALLAAAEGDWMRAAQELERVTVREPENVLAVNNYAVALLGQGRVREAIDAMEAALRASPAATTAAEPFLFNLSTMYELRGGLAAPRKRALLLEVAKWSGDGLRTACLKLAA